MTDRKPDFEDACADLEPEMSSMATTVTSAPRAAADDRLARFEDFASAHQDRAYRLAYRLLGGDRAAAEDVAQEAFLRAYRGLSRFRDEAALSTWFTRILIREAGRHRRWSGVRRLWHGGSTDDVPLPAPERPDGDPGLRRRIQSGLAKLTGRQRDAFVLIHMEGYTVAETADLLGASPGTIKSHLHRALVSLRKELGDLRGVEEGVSS